MPVTLPFTSERNLTPRVTGTSLFHGIAGTVEVLQIEVPVRGVVLPRFRVAVLDTPFSVAVMVALWSPGTAVLAALKVADVEPAAMVTDEGTVKAALLEEI